MNNILKKYTFYVLLVSSALAAGGVSGQALATETPTTTADGKPLEYAKIFKDTVAGRSPREYFREVNSGWASNLAQLRDHLQGNKSYLVIHAQEPKRAYDLREANKFKESLMSHGILNLQGDTLGVGHVFISWRCKVKRKMVEGTVGMTGELNDQFATLLKNGHGLAAFLAIFEDGHIQTPKLLNFEFESEQPMHTVAVEVDPSICQNAIKFVQKFMYHERQPRFYFGFNLDPTKFEGGGCGSFGTAILQESKIFGNLGLVKDMWRRIPANENLFGYGLPAPYDVAPFQLRSKGKRSVSKFEMFVSDWDPVSKKAPFLEIMDPELFVLFLKTVYQQTYYSFRKSSPRVAKEFYRHPLYGKRFLMVDKGKNPFVESISGNFAVKEKIDRKFDRKARTIVYKTRKWLKSLGKKNYRARIAKMRAGNGKPFFAIILGR